MRRFSIHMILLLCLALLFVDVIAFYWLTAITKFITYLFLRNLIYGAFWIFTFGLIISIIVLKIRMETINPIKKYLLISSLYGLAVASFVPKLIFVIVISILYFGNYVLSEDKSLIIVPAIAVFSGFLPFFVIVYGVFKTLYRFKIHRLTIHFNLLPKIFNGLKIVHISDLHLGSFNFRYHILERAVTIINDLKPDFIFFTGDLVNNYEWELKGWDLILSKLEAKIGKYSVLGNHDYGDYSEWELPEFKKANFEHIKEFHKKIGFKLLLNDGDVIRKDTEMIAIVGVENWGNPPFKQYGDLQKSLYYVKGIPFKILLSHDPTHWPEEVVKHTNIDLTLSGHTHGMQAGINIKSKKWSPIKYKYEHWAGLYKQHEQYLYVNRGLGWLGFPGRLGMRPEITLIELKKKNKQ